MTNKKTKKDKAPAQEVPRNEPIFLAMAESLKGMEQAYSEAAVDNEINRKYGNCNEINTLLKAILKELVWARRERSIHG